MTALAIATAAPKNADRLRIVRTAEETALPFGDHAGFPLCVAEHTGGEFTLAMGEFPAASGTSPHIHHREDEYFYVLEGTFTAYVGGQAHVLTPGTFALLPKDVPHCFRNTGGTHGRMLIGFTPSGFEKMFAAMAEATAHVPVGTRQADMLPILAEVTDKFGVTMLPPSEGDLAAGTLHPDTRPEDLARVRVLKTGEGRRTISLDHGITRKAVSADTNGELAWMVCDAMPGAGTPPHIHHREDEQFFVLSGSLVAWVDGAGEITLNAGDYVLLPRGVAHRWTAVGPGETTFLVLTNPGGFEEMFDAIAEATSDPKLPMPVVFDLVTKAAARFGVEILPPPGAPALQGGAA